jgi:Zn-finger nucleic acid-binding protein
MSGPDAVHCSGCGRDLGLEPIGHSDAIECTVCRLAMSAFECGPGALHDCDQCGGQFVEHAALRALLERHDELEIPFARQPAATGRATAPVRYIECPVCRSMMNRKNFGATSGVIVDVCTKHGTWFDTGELPRVLAFVESGGAGATLQTMQDRDAPAFAKESIVVDLLRELFGF